MTTRRRTQKNENEKKTPEEREDEQDEETTEDKDDDQDKKKAQDDVDVDKHLQQENQIRQTRTEDQPGREAEYQEEEREEEDQETLSQAHKQNLPVRRCAVSIRPQDLVEIRRVRQARSCKTTEVRNRDARHREEPQAGRPNSTTENAITYMYAGHTAAIETLCFNN